jgi:hypothetical protein
VAAGTPAAVHLHLPDAHLLFLLLVVTVAPKSVAGLKWYQQMVDIAAAAAAGPAAHGHMLLVQVMQWQQLQHHAPHVIAGLTVLLLSLLLVPWVGCCCQVQRTLAEGPPAQFL